MKPLFVTGTDTDCGKTFVSALLARAAKDAGLQPAYYKPFETGCPDNNGTLQSAELAEVMRISGNAVGTRVSVPYRFDLPVAPYTAAIRQGVMFDWERLDDLYKDLQEKSDVLIVEGAGGLLVPIEKETSYLDLLKRWEMDVVLVVGNKLGCINHTLLTLRVLEAEGIAVKALVLNHMQLAATPAQQSNRWTLEALLDRPIDFEIDSDLEQSTETLKALFRDE